MQKVTNYQLVAASDKSYFENKVNKLIRLGWVPQGGVATDTNSGAPSSYVQSMVKYEESDPSAHLLVSGPTGLIGDPQ